MGERAYYNGYGIKIGTCESMYYLRYEDRCKVDRDYNSVDPAKCKNLFFRAPAIEEDGIEPGRYPYRLAADGLDMYHSSLRIIDFPSDCKDEILKEHGIVQLRHNSGVLVNLPCYHGLKLPDTTGTDIKVFWNGRRDSLYINSLKNTDSELRVCVSCWECNKMWSFSFADIVNCIYEDRMVLRLYEQCANYLDNEWSFPLVRNTKRDHKTRWDWVKDEVQYKVSYNKECNGFNLEWEWKGDAELNGIKFFTDYKEMSEWIIEEFTRTKIDKQNEND